MHILVINDDGPPSSQSSPYVHAFVAALQVRGHAVSVVLPHVQRSWIGKAHFAHQTVKPTYFRPGTVHEDTGTTHSRPLSTSSPGEEWVLVNGTPATCAQLGIYHFYQDRGPVDLVVSGPNFGRNSTSLFSLSSGTVGGAMEAAVCGKRAISLSFAFQPEKRYECKLIDAASQHSAKVVEYLAHNWDSGVDLYNINVPLVENVESRKILWTNILQNAWSRSCLKATEAIEDDETPDEREAELRQREERESRGQASNGEEAKADIAGEQDKTFSRHEHRHFAWSPSFADVYNSVKESQPGNDGWAVAEDYTSVTPLKANFMHAIKHEGELKLLRGADNAEPLESLAAHINYEDDYVQPMIETALARLNSAYELVGKPLSSNTPSKPFLQISQYESIDHDQLFNRPTSFLANTYIIRKALIRKEYLALITRLWSAKNSESALARSIPETISLHLDYAEFLDDELMAGDGMTLLPIFEANKEKEPADRQWWLVKASMADRGQGIRLFSTYEELQGIFEEWEEPEEDADDDAAMDSARDMEDDRAAGMTSSLRHFVLQKYIPPLLLELHGNRKFHIRCYVVAVGALKVYVSRDMLALFAAKPYTPPAEATDELDLAAHLTNTCLQDGTREGSVKRFWDLPDNNGLQSNNHDENTSGADDWKQNVFDHVCKATGQLFHAAIAAPTDFQPLPNAFELYGVDWLVGPLEDGERQPRAWLLEVNAFPDLKQTGDELKDLIQGLWNGIFAVAVAPFFGLSVEQSQAPERLGMIKVLDQDMRRQR